MHLKFILYNKRGKDLLNFVNVSKLPNTIY